MARCRRGILVFPVLLGILMIFSLLSCLAASTAPAAQPGKPVIAVVPNQVTFIAKAGENPKFEQLLTVTNQGGGVLDWVAGDNSPWIELQKGDGTTGVQSCCIRIMVDATGMAAGEYTGLVTISAANAMNSPVYVPVRLSIPGAGSAPPLVGQPQQASPAAGAPPDSSAVVWKNSIELYRYADTNALIVNGSITNTDRLWYMSDVAISSKSGQTVNITQTLPPGETILYYRYIPAYALEEVNLKYNWYRP